MPEVGGELTATDVAAIQEASARYVATALARDFDAWMDISADDAVFMPPHGEALDTRDKIRGWIEAFPRLTMFRVMPVEVQGRAGLAYVRGRYEYIAEGASDKGKYIEIWRKQPDGGWRIVRDIWNSDDH